MGVEYMARQIYQDVITRVTRTEADWKAVCRLAGQIYRYEFDNVLMVYAQRPSSTLVADYDIWKKVHRYVKRGSRGIAIFPSRALKPGLRYVFDISDTGGKDVKLTWDLEGENLPDLLSALWKRGEVPEAPKTDRKSQMEQLKAFTKQEVRGILKEDFGKQFVEAAMLAGREITGGENETPELAAQRLVFNSIFYAVGTRCGFDLSSGEQDLGTIVNVKDEGCISVLGTLVSDVSCTVLRNMNREIMNIEKERKVRYGNTGNQLPRGRGRDAVPGHQSSGADGNRDVREVRNHGAGVSGGKLPAEIPESGKVRKPLPETERSGGGGKQDVRQHHGEVSGKPQAGEPAVHNGDVPHQKAGDDGGRGNHPPRPHQPVSLETQEELYDERASLSSSAFAISPLQASEIAAFNKELDDLNSFGTEREAVYRQASLFDYKETGLDDEQGEMLEPEVKDTQEQLDGYAIPDEADQMGVPDAVRFEQEQRENEREPQEKWQELKGQTETEQVPAADTENQTSVQPQNYVIDLHHQETGGEKTRY